MTCEEALKKLYEVIDKEADEYDVKEVKAHLQHCKSCMARYQFEEMFKTFVTDKASSASKTELLKKKISTKIEDLEKNPRTREDRKGFFGGSFRRQLFYIGAAAALVVFVVAAFSVSGYYQRQAFLDPFEERHMAVHQMNMQEMQAADNETEVAQFINSDMHLALSENNNGYKMVSCCFDEVQGQRFAHLRYLNDGTHVSLFVGKPDGVNLPDFERRIHNNVEYYWRECQDCQVIYWNTGGALVIAVSDNKNIPLTEFIPALAAI